MTKIIYCFLIILISNNVFCNLSSVTIRDRNSSEYLNLHNGAAQIVDYAHEKGHDGVLFEVCTINMAVADGATTNILINPDKESHLTGAVVAEGKAYVILYEDPSYTGGTTLNIICTNRNTNRTTTNATAVINPSVTNVGTKLTCELLVGGEGPRSPGGTATRTIEWILNPNKTYLLVMQNLAGSEKDHGVNLVWYEED